MCKTSDSFDTEKIRVRGFKSLGQTMSTALLIESQGVTSFEILCQGVTSFEILCQGVTSFEILCQRVTSFEILCQCVTSFEILMKNKCSPCSAGVSGNCHPVKNKCSPCSAGVSGKETREKAARKGKNSTLSY
ncbi:hypothetical protein ACOMHN_015478 [Nucella lapillus]